MFGVCLLSLAVNFAVQWRSDHVVQFSSEASNVARALLNGRGFADPYMTGPSGPTAQMAPIYPFLYASLCRVFGTGALGWSAIIAVTALAWGLQWVFAYLFARSQGHERAGLAAAIAGAALPLPGRLFKWEAVFTGLALAISALIVSRICKGDARTRTLVGFGVLLGIGVLLSPVLILVWPFWGLILLRQQGLRPLAIALPVALLVVSPWTIRNYLVLQHFVFIRDDAGIAFGSSNNDCATAVLSENIASGCFSQLHPSGNVEILQKLNAAHEYDFCAEEMRRTVAWVRTNPGRFTVLSLERAIYFWFPLDPVDRPSLLNGVIMSGATVLSLLGLLWMRSLGFMILVATLLPYTVSYYFAQFEQRYHYPVLWISVLLGAIGIELLLKRRLRPNQ
jgi:hypothetical protein